MSLQVDACVGQHQGDRAEQQDRVAILQHPRKKQVFLAVVADGMGGHTGGRLAAEQILHTSRGALSNFLPGEEPVEQMLTECINESHILINAMSFINEKNPHSTSTSFYTDGETAWWAHCGDSRLYHFHRKKFVAHTEDHSLVNHLLKSNQISEEAALSHPQRNVLLTAVGGEQAPQIDLAGPHKLRAGDAFLLCSDGLWAYFTPEEMGMVVAVMNARDCCESLIGRARDLGNGGGDNISLAVLKFY